MGLDLCFNRAKAVAAGLKIELQRNGSDLAIAKAIEENQDPDYIAWLKQDDEVIHIPGTDYWVLNGSYGENVIVRANKWGPCYVPMTTWLKANNIEWSEA